MLETRLFRSNDAEEIGDLYRRARANLVDSVCYSLQCGKRLVEKKSTLNHGEWQNWLEVHADILGFGDRTARMLVALAKRKLASGMTETEALAISRQTWGHEAKIKQLEDMHERRVVRERELGDKIRALPEQKFGVIMADPPWKFASWGPGGLDRSAGNHYLEQEVNEIAALKIGELAYDDSVLFLWATVPMIEVAFAVLRGWGFDYRSQVIWNKDKQGTGFWFRNKHEILLVGVRGNPPGPAPGTQWATVIDAPRGEHSAKPDIFYELIEAYFPNVPKLELYARKRREGWEPWGNEINQTEMVG